MATQLEYSCLGNPMVRGAWRARVHGTAMSLTRLSDKQYSTTYTALTWISALLEPLHVIIIQSSQQPDKVATIIIPIFQMVRLRCRKLETLA